MGDRAPAKYSGDDASKKVTRCCCQPATTITTTTDMIDFGKIGAFPRIGGKYTDQFSDYRKTCNKRKSQSQNAGI